ncbi:F0F1 ATP synthase subunit B [Jonesia denitrificans]|uniref:ATP synthase subunit b n=1 Tax=Jonesia denitrificans (strain ATCC 14870 / DSM 20603 / BCRC 15368 / CIP 55.134 / JCM 11481 / NBRC 15587 / NCTC 10816 / Prevot 55134) TaxID=471856 RepID=C7QZC3_JONDD|nr:F0F1 ATP synthase subunit B [Jonesia denitrificans]ACV09421.1 ATP synthase F0, B subunit [Jonesia denitrificans DSM 20603]ASE09336.1 F0F1 ATP synthase subunit B [Jonesia denitrificans]QXB43877.1 F0F1 ATP synthase subunit B [Jonesia denitrificans]SQH21750.1 F-type ATPase subunit b [Jonesia denitrificans]
MSTLTTTTAVLAAGGDEVSGIDLFIPPLYDIVGSALVLLIIGAYFYKVILPKFNAVLDERTAKIEGGIHQAERAQEEADKLLAEHRQLLTEARAEAGAVREAARTEAAQIKAEAQAQANADAERILENAKRQIDAERQAAAVSLRNDVGALATDLASKIVGEALDDVARQSRVVERFLDDLESSTVTTTAKGK